MKLTDDHNWYNRFVVKHGLRRNDSFGSSASQYKEQKLLCRKIKELLTLEVREEIVATSADRIYNLQATGIPAPLISQADFDILLEKLDQGRNFSTIGFEKLLEFNITWAFLFLKYPRKFSYLLKHVEF